jgi:hypothetical protein
VKKSHKGTRATSASEWSLSSTVFVLKRHVKTLTRKRTKRKKKKPAKQWFSFRAKSAAKKKTRPTKAGPGRRVFLTVFGAGCILAAVAAGFVLLDRYVQKITSSGKVGPLELVGQPGWFNNELVQKVHDAAGGSEFSLDATTARTVAENLASIAWLYDVKVQTTGSSVQINAKYRRPVGLIRRPGTAYYIGRDAVVLQYLPIEDLTIVEIKGFSAREIAPVGDRMGDDDIVAAVELLGVLERMDEISTPKAPLLREIASIDVSNLNGRKSRSRAHIVLNAKDGTQVNWGAAYGRSARYVEASETEKIAMLYEFYTQNGTIQGKVKYIELRNPQEAVPRPTAP